MRVWHKILIGLGGLGVLTLGLVALFIDLPLHAADPNTGSSVVRFANQVAKQTFLRVNQLRSNQLKAVPKLHGYVVKHAGRRLKGARGVTIQPNRQYRVLMMPNDSLYSLQYALPKIAAPAGWDVTTGSSSSMIAVVDTGFGLSHEDLTTKWQTNSGEQGAITSEGPAPNCTSRNLVLA